MKKLTVDPKAFPIPQPLENLALSALSQIRDSLDALTQSDVYRAQTVIAVDCRVDLDYRAVQKQLKIELIREPERINTWLRLVNTARNLERIADHAVKIAESVIYLKEGEFLQIQLGQLTSGAGINGPQTSSSNTLSS